MVRTSGAQTVSGNKSFSAITTFASDIFRDARNSGYGSADYIALANTSVVKGTTPATSSMSRFMFLDGTASTSAVPDSKKLGSIDLIYTTENTTVAKLVAFQPVADSTNNATLSVVYPASGEPYTVAPSTRDVPNNTEIVTVDYLKGANSGVVHTSGNETIAGAKTFTNGPTIREDASAARAYCTLTTDAITAGTPPASGSTYDMGMRFTDKVGEVLGMYKFRYDDAGDAALYMQVSSPVADDDTNTSITLNYTADGERYATCPPTRTTPVDNEIVTVDFLSKAESNLVHRTGNETIDGLKTFAYSAINIQEPKYTINEDPTSDQYWNIQFKDSTNTTLGDILFYHNADANGGGSGISLRILNHDGTDVPANRRSLQLTYDNDTGNTYAICPSTRTTPAQNEIITYDFLQKFVEENGGGSLGNISDVYYIPTSSLSYSWKDAGYQESGGTCTVTFSIPSGGSWLLFGSFSWNDNSDVLTSGGVHALYAGGTRVSLRDSTSSMGAHSTSLRSSNLLCFRIA